MNRPALASMNLPIIAASLLLSLAIPLTAAAGTITVANTADAGSGSLRQAVADAASGDSILFDPSLSGQTITLTTGQIQLSKDLNLDASALPQRVAISGDNSSRILHIAPGGHTVSLNFLILAAGKTPDGTGSSIVGQSGDFGGAIMNEEGTLELDDCELTGNSTGSGQGSEGLIDGGHGGVGGAICNSGGSLTMRNCRLIGNFTGAGGFSGVYGGFPGHGGAIYSYNCLTVLRECHFSGNHTGNGGDGGSEGGSGGDGGAIFDGDGTLIILDCTFSGNFTGDGGDASSGRSGRGGTGGAVVVGGGTAFIEDCQMTDNFAGHSGAGSIYGVTSGGTGGAIANYSGLLTLLSSSVSDNRAGDGIFGGSGGAIFNSDGEIIIRDSTLSGNSGGNGGFNETTGGGYGGAIYTHRGALSLRNTTLADNTAGEGSGGRGSGGGAIYSVQDGAENGLSLIYCTLSGNHGGAVSSTRGNLDIRNCLIAGNTNANGPADIHFDSEIPAPVLTVTGALLVSDSEGFSITGGPPAIIAAQPLLSPLGDYGGKTPTMPPLPGSPAIDAAITLDPQPPFDQRGLLRPNGSAPDIGAAETHPFHELHLVDADNDGIDDRFELGHFGNLTTANTTSDTDGDGSNDRDEIGNMTNPNNSADLLRILSFTPYAYFDPASPSFDVTISTFPGLDYQLESSATLSDPSGWVPSGTITAHGTSRTFGINLYPGQGFVRAKRK